MVKRFFIIFQILALSALMSSGLMAAELNLFEFAKDAVNEMLAKYLAIIMIVIILVFVAWNVFVNQRLMVLIFAAVAILLIASAPFIAPGVIEFFRGYTPSPVSVTP